MVESIEPRFRLGRKVLTVVLHLAVVALAFWMGYLLIYGGEPESPLTPAQVRRAVNEFREQRRARMIQETLEMRSLQAEMRQIRDNWRRQAELQGELDLVLDEQERLHRLRSARELEALSFEEIYDTARSIEQDVITIYREYLTARMMDLRRGLEYAEAYDHAATPRTSRPELDTAALHRDITTVAPAGGIAEFRDQIRRSVVEVREMGENIDKLLTFTRRSEKQAGDGISVDFSADDVAMIGYRGPELMPDEIDLTHSPDVGNFASIPGRRLVTGGRHDEWLYVDTWYIIGPFPSDRRRTNLDVRFGPEANVNLDDVFTGLDGRSLRWDYTKVGWTQPEPPRRGYWKIEPREVVAYGIYYAFTEIYSDAPREVWIATGTDDYGKLWINDDLVWVSPTGRKPYNATENIQPVRLQQGHNRILYRVENAGGTMGFSLMINMMAGG